MATYIYIFVIISLNYCCGKVMFSQAYVILSVHRGRGCVSQHAMGQGVCIPACNWAGGVYPSMQLGKGV